MTFAQQTVDDVYARPCILPSLLIEARAAVFDGTKCLDLGMTARRTLFGILSFFNLSKPNSAIFPRRNRLRADALLSSEATLYRGLKELESKGYITRGQIRSNLNGRYHVSPIKLLNKTLILLGIQCIQNKVVHRYPSCKMKDGLYKEHPNKKQSLLKSISKEQIQKICPRTRLPIPLLPFLDLGLSPTAICWLMAQAKKHYKRLEDVMISAWRYISHLKGKAVIAYILALFKKDQDFQAVRISLEEKHTERLREETAQARISALDRRFDNFVVLARNGRKIGIFDSEARAVICDENRVLPVNMRFGHLLVEGKIRLVPPDKFQHIYPE